MNIDIGMMDLINEAFIIGMVSKGAISLLDCLEMEPSVLKKTRAQATEYGKKLGIIEDKNG